MGDRGKNSGKGNGKSRDKNSSNGPTRFVGVDIGGTKIYALVLNGKGKILGKCRKKTKPKLGFKGVMERVGACCVEACESAGLAIAEVTAVGVGAPSPILGDGTAVHAVNLGWKGVPLVKTLKKLIGRPVYAENDCNAGTLGEYAFGGGKGAASLVGFFMGTGLGGGIVYRGELITGENRMAAEVGHAIVVKDGRACNCGKKGCLEAYASKVGMGRRFSREILYQGRKSVLLDKCSPEDLANVRSGVLAECFRAGDEVTVETLTEAAEFLGLGIGNMITVFGPDVVVVGGGVYEALGKELLPITRKAAKAVVHPVSSFKDTRISLASLGDDAVAMGAMVYARKCAAGE